jgi:hypothetical protein
MRTARNLLAAAAVAAVALGCVVAAVALFARAPADAVRPVWTEVQWPFPADPWGRGRAFHCRAADCGTDIDLYVRAKLGGCNCVTGIADDEALDRMGDIDLVTRESLPRGAGRPVAVAWMNGRSRTYALTGPNPPGKTALSVAFNDRCDMVVATAVVPHDRTDAIEPKVIAFLNSETVLDWTRRTLGI